MHTAKIGDAAKENAGHIANMGKLYDKENADFIRNPKGWHGF